MRWFAGTPCLLLPLLCSSLAVQACSKPAAPSTSTLQPATSAPAASSLHHAVANPDLPPIDCPLRKAGIDPHALKPFEQVQQYIDFLEREDRAAWQKPGDLIASLKLAGSETVADVGAGSGYFSFPLARALPKGKVIAIDVEPEMLRHIHHKAMTRGVSNIEVALATNADPKVPATADVVFMCDVLHHVPQRDVWLGTLHKQMRSGARLVVVEFKEGDLPAGPPSQAKIPRAELLRLGQAAGFTFVAEKADLLPYQLVLEFHRP